MNLFTTLPTERLTPEEENELAKLGTEDARNKLVMHAMPEALAYAKRCCRGALHDDELFSQCYEELQKAARNFKPNIIRFFGYAKIYVRRGVAALWREKDLVKNSSMHESDVEAAPAPPAPHISSDDIVDAGSTDLDLSEDSRFGTEDFNFRLLEIREQWGIVEPVMEQVLSEHERMVIDLYYAGGLSFENIGEMLGISRQAIQMAHIRAMKKICGALLRKKTLFLR